MEKNINFSISTDDPGVMQCDFQSEIIACHNKLGLNYTQIAQLFVNAAKASFLNQNDKAKLIVEIEKRTMKWLNIVGAE